MSFEDEVAIRALTDRYMQAAARLDPVAMAAVYTDDGEVIAFGNRFAGRPAIEAVFASTIGLMQVLNQSCSGGVITVDGDRATAAWTVTEYAKRKDLEQLDLFIGDYADELVRTKDGWRFQRRTLTRRLQARMDAKLRV